MYFFYSFSLSLNIHLAVRTGCFIPRWWKLTYGNTFNWFKDLNIISSYPSLRNVFLIAEQNTQLSYVREERTLLHCQPWKETFASDFSKALALWISKLICRQTERLNVNEVTLLSLKHPLGTFRPWHMWSITTSCAKKPNSPPHAKWEVLLLLHSQAQLKAGGGNAEGEVRSPARCFLLSFMTTQSLTFFLCLRCVLTPPSSTVAFSFIFLPSSPVLTHKDGRAQDVSRKISTYLTGTYTI